MPTAIRIEATHSPITVPMIAPVDRVSLSGVMKSLEKYVVVKNWLPDSEWYDALNCLQLLCGTK